MEIEYVNAFYYKDMNGFLKSKRLKNYIKKNNYLYEVVDDYPEDKPTQVVVLVYKIKGVTDEWRRSDRKNKAYRQI